MHARAIDIIFASRVVLAVWTQRGLCIREALVFADQIDYVHPVTTSATLKPEIHHIVDRCPNFRGLPVEIRLFRCEKREVVLVCLGVVGPLQEFRVSVLSLSYYTVK